MTGGLRALLLVCVALVIAAAPARAGTPAPLRPAGPWVVDPQGRVVIVHGLQVAHKTPPYHAPPEHFGAADARRISRWGFNAVRLAWFWKGLEPERGHYDDAYAAEILREARALEREGIMVQLEAHQDSYNERLHGAGFPDWATFTDGAPVLPSTPGVDGVAPATDRAFDNLYADRDGIGTAFADAWAHMARVFARHRPALGYDLFNEPYPGSRAPTCLQPAGCPQFDRAVLGPFQDRLARGVRRGDPASLVWYEPGVAFDFGAASWLGPPPQDVGPAAFAFHDYCLAAIPGGSPDNESHAPGYPVCPVEDGRVFDNARQSAARMGVPELLDEFGDTEDRAQIARVADMADRRLVGWLYWAYKDWVDVPGGLGSGALFGDSDDERTLRRDKLLTLSRPYPMATAGIPLASRFDAATGAYELSYRPDPAITAPTIVFTAPLHYPHGPRIAVTGVRRLRRDGAGRLLVWARPGARNVSVRLARR